MDETGRAGTASDQGPPRTPAANPETRAAIMPNKAAIKSLESLIALGLVLITFLSYGPVWRFDFVNFDDPDYVTANTHVQAGLTPTSIAWAFGTSHSGNWHPLTWISYMADVQFFGLRPGPAHVVNLLLHLANTVLLFFLLRRLTNTFWRSALVAALFGVHPLHVESVAWIAERKDVLSTLFGFLSLLAYANYAQAKVHRAPGNEFVTTPGDPAAALTIDNRESPAAQANKSYRLALVFFALGLLCKPMLVTLPFVMLLLDFWPLGRMKPVPACVGSLIREKLPFLALTVVSSVVTFFVQRHAGAMQTLSTYPASIRIENALLSYARYLGKAFWPFSLATPYSHPGQWPATTVLFAVLLIVGLSGAALRLGRRLPFVPTGWFWFLGMLVPVIGLVQVGAQSMADRYTYVPLVGIFIILAWGLAELASRSDLSRMATAAFGGLLVFLCGVRTRDQLRNWANTESLFVHALAVTKNNWMAHYNLGWHLQEHGQLDEALDHYRQTVEIKPAAADALNNMGIVSVEQKHFDLAIPYFEAALAVKPEFYEARDNLGKCLAALGKTNEAMAQFQAVLQAKPDHIGALNNVANALVLRGQLAEAAAVYMKSLRANPDQVSAHYNLGYVLVRLRRPDEAIQQYRLALARDPNFAEAHHDLGYALARQGRAEEALTQFREAVRCKPTDALMHRTLGKALVATSQFKEAAAEYREALRLKPDFSQAQKELNDLLVQAPAIGERSFYR